MSLHPLIVKYVDEVVEQIKAKELRGEIREEIGGHLEELMDRKLDEGINPEDAAVWAIAQMGETSMVASGLNQVHKPRIPWGMLGNLALLLTIALVIMYVVDLSYSARNGRLAGADLFGSQVTSIGIGLVALLLFSRLDYRKLLPKAGVLYGGTVALLFVLQFRNHPSREMLGFIALGPIEIDFVELSVYLFILSAAGILYQSQKNWKAIGWHFLLFGVVPILLYGSLHTYSMVLIYMGSYLLLLLLSGYGWKWLVPHALSLFLLTIFLLANDFVYRSRLTAFFHSHQDPDGSGYYYIQIAEAIRSTGWWGHGFGSVIEHHSLIHNDVFFTYILYSLGWSTGFLILVSILAFMSQLVRLARSVHDTYGKMLITGIGAILAVKFIWSIGMSVGLLPIVGIDIPFISFGGSGMLVQLAAIGIIYSVYRRKDLIQVQ